MQNKFLLVLFFLLSTPSFAHGAEGDRGRDEIDQPYGWVALPRDRPFPPLMSDPRDLKTALRKNSKKQLEADVGAFRSFAGWKGTICKTETIIHTGIEGGAFFNMRQEGAKFPLNSSDGWIGFYAESRHGRWRSQLRFTHISAHLSDGLTDTRARIVYTRESLSYRLLRQFGIFHVYAGYHLLVHTVPVLPKSSGQFGFYSILPWGTKVRPFIGADLKLKSKEEGTTYSLSTGLALTSFQGMPPVRFALNYLSGHDQRGQFYREKLNKFSAGLEMDL